MIVVCALYKFVPVEKHFRFKKPLLRLMEKHNITGTLLLAHEGINGTVAGERTAIDTLLKWLNSQAEFSGVGYKESYTEHMPFKRRKVKLKKEIVTLGVEGIDPLKSVGTYVNAEEWNALISSPDVVLIDTRNDYEVEVGTFKNAVNPNTERFRDFPAYVKKNLDPNKHKKVAMFCTGGIRCEKSTAYLKQQGFEEVYHLHGGVLKYLETVPQEQTMWQGECFVFDERVTVNHKLEKGTYSQCHACRRPITEQDMQSPQYKTGLSCPYCYNSLSEKQKESFAERQKQIALAKARGEKHIGLDVEKQNARRRDKKQADKIAKRDQKKVG